MIPPSFTQKLLSKVVRQGENGHFEARIFGDPAPQVTWFHCGQPIDSAGAPQNRYEIVQSSDLCQLIIHGVQPTDAGPVKISALNSGGEAICIADLLVAPSSPQQTRSNQHALSHSLLYLNHPENSQFQTQPVVTGSTQESTMVSSFIPGRQTSIS